MSAPQFERVFTTYATIDASNLRLVSTGAGQRTNMLITGYYESYFPPISHYLTLMIHGSGYFESPDGKQFAKIVPGMGGDHGVLDAKGVFHPGEMVPGPTGCVMLSHRN